MILVTGATGLLGSHLVKELVKRGMPVRAIYRNTIPEDLRENVEWVKGDILDPLSLEDAMQHIRQVYHCAATVSFNPRKKKELHQTNVEGTANVVNACLTAGIQKLLFVSSVAALGRIREDKPINEKMKWTKESSNSEYGKTKYLAEMEVWRGIGEGLSAIIINPVIILGAGDWEKGSSEIFKTAYKQFPWYTEGSSGFVYVLDVVNAMILLMNGKADSERFIISSENKMYKDVFTEIATNFQKKPPHKRVTPLLASLVWRIEALKGKLTGNEPLLTKETAKTALAKVNFDNSKFFLYAPNFKFTPVNEAIQRICSELKMKYSL